MIQHQPGVTQLLARWQSGDEEAGRDAFDLVYGELRRLAGQYLRAESPAHTLQATALVHEAYLRLIGGRVPELADRGHLIAIAARLMRQILVNHALRRDAAKRGGRWRRRSLEAVVAELEGRCDDLVALDEALHRLADRDARLAEVVELRFFGGLSIDATARLLDTSCRTVERQWSLARAWLRRELSSDAGAPSPAVRRSRA